MRNEIESRYQRLLSVKTFIIFIGSIVLLLLQGCGQGPTEDLTSLTLPSTPTYYLMCPPNYCNVTPNEITPVYNISADDLFNAWNILMSHQQNLQVLGSVPEKGQVDYVQRSTFGFPDRITVQLVALSDNTSTLAVYSRSIYGFYDFDLNKQRLHKWITQLNQIVTNMPPTMLNANANDNSDNATDTTDVKNALTTNALSGITANTSTDNGDGTTTDNSGATSTDNSAGTTSTTTTTSTDSSGATSTDNSAGTAVTSTDNSSAASTDNSAPTSTDNDGTTTTS